MVESQGNKKVQIQELTIYYIELRKIISDRILFEKDIRSFYLMTRATGILKRFASDFRNNKIVNPQEFKKEMSQIITFVKSNKRGLFEEYRLYLDNIIKIFTENKQLIIDEENKQIASAAQRNRRTNSRHQAEQRVRKEENIATSSASLEVKPSVDEVSKSSEIDRSIREGREEEIVRPLEDYCVEQIGILVQKNKLINIVQVDQEEIAKELQSYYLEQIASLKSKTTNILLLKEELRKALKSFFDIKTSQLTSIIIADSDILLKEIEGHIKLISSLDYENFLDSESYKFGKTLTELAKQYIESLKLCSVDVATKANENITKLESKIESMNLLVRKGEATTLALNKLNEILKTTKKYVESLQKPFKDNEGFKNFLSFDSFKFRNDLKMLLKKYENPELYHMDELVEIKEKLELELRSMDLLVEEIKNSSQANSKDKVTEGLTEEKPDEFKTMSSKQELQTNNEFGINFPLAEKNISAQDLEWDDTYDLVLSNPKSDNGPANEDSVIRSLSELKKLVEEMNLTVDSSSIAVQTDDFNSGDIKNEKSEVSSSGNSSRPTTLDINRVFSEGSSGNSSRSATPDINRVFSEGSSGNSSRSATPDINRVFSEGSSGYSSRSATPDINRVFSEGSSGYSSRSATPDINRVSSEGSSGNSSRSATVDSESQDRIVNIVFKRYNSSKHPKTIDSIYNDSLKEIFINKLRIAEINIEKQHGKLYIQEKNMSIYGAVISGNMAVLKRLLNKGVDINAKDDRGKTPLHYACEYGWSNIVSLLLEKGVNVNDKSKVLGYLPLHYAVESGNEEIVKKLLAYNDKIEVNSISKIGGYTPLHLAVIGRRSELARILLMRGDSSMFLTSSGNTSYDLLDLHLSGISERKVGNVERINQSDEYFKEILNAKDGPLSDLSNSVIEEINVSISI